MTEVTVLGAGNMGAALTQAFLAGGHSTTVWNRNPERCAPLVERGARLAATPEAALSASPVTVACVIDYGALQAVLDAAGDGAMLRGRTLVNLSTGTPEQAVEMADAITARGGRYLDGAIPCYPASVGGPDQIIVFSGDPSVWQAHRDLLVALGGRSTHVADDVSTSNILDLALVGAFYHVAYAGFIEAAAYATRLGARLVEIAPLAAQLAGGFLVETVGLAVDAMERQSYETDQATVDVHLDALRMIQRSMRANGQRPRLTGAVVDYLEEAHEAGHGQSSMASLFEMMGQPSGDLPSGADGPGSASESR